MRRAAAHLISWHAEPGEGTALCKGVACDESAAAAKPCSLPATLRLCDRHLHKVVTLFWPRRLFMQDFHCKLQLALCGRGRSEGGRQTTDGRDIFYSYIYLPIQLA